MQKLIKISFLIFIGVFLYGCAKPVDNIALPESFWQNPKHNIVIAKTKFEGKPQIHKMGQQGLIDHVISSGVTQTFGKYLKQFKMGWYSELQQKFVAQLKKRKISSHIYPMDIASKQKKNITAVIQMEGDEILLLDLQHIGAIRNYYGFIPTSAPKAYCVLKGELIEQQTKKVLWSHSVKIEEAVQGDWDQPPAYPNFTAALNQAIDSAEEEIIDSFFSGH